MKPEIKAIIFDVGGVVIFYDHMIATRKMSKIIHVPAKQIFKIINNSKSKFELAYELGSPKNIYWGVMEKELNVEIPYKKFDELWCTIFRPNKKMFSMIRKLKKRYKIGLISNTGSLHKKYLFKKYPIEELFSVRVFSYKIKARKPSPKSFKITLKKLGVRPGESIFIDDIYKNVQGAKKLGIRGILFRNNKQAIKELKKLLR